jgi:hypothetical protein
VVEQAVVEPEPVAAPAGKGKPKTPDTKKGGKPKTPPKEEEPSEEELAAKAAKEAEAAEAEVAAAERAEEEARDAQVRQDIATAYSSASRIAAFVVLMIPTPTRASCADGQGASHRGAAGAAHHVRGAVCARADQRADRDARVSDGRHRLLAAVAGGLAVPLSLRWVLVRVRKAAPLKTRPNAAARSALEVFAGWASPFSHGLFGVATLCCPHVR